MSIVRKITYACAAAFVIALIAPEVCAQESDSLYINKIVQKNPKRFEYYFNGGFGFYLPVNSPSALGSRGAMYTFQAQVNYKDNFFSRLAFDQYNISYQDNVNLNGINTFIKDKVQTTLIGIDLGYTGHISNRLAWFSYVGVGWASMDVPIKMYDLATNVLRLDISTRNFLSLRGGAGLEYEFSKLFIVFVEAQYLSIPFKTDLSNQQLNGYGLQIGFKTPLQ